MAENQQYLPLIRSLRPSQWDQVIGQGHVIRGISKSLADGRVKNGYLFIGDKGLGKTTTARLIAATLNCPNRDEGDPNPCGECESCKSVLSGHSMYVTEVDCGQAGGVDDMRDLAGKAQLGSGQRYRVFILDEFHLASTPAKTALLKSIEEPNRNVVWVICTTEPQKVPPAIRSRCASYEFRHVSVRDLSSYLKMVIDDLVEDEQYDDEATSYTDSGLNTIVELADGSVREALSILESVLDHGDGVNDDTIRDVSGRATATDIEVMVKAIIAGNLDHAARLMRDLYHTQMSSSILSYLFSVVLPRSGGMKSVDRRNAVQLIRAIINFTPSFHESVNRDLLLFCMFDAIHDAGDPPKTSDSKKKTKSKAEPVKKKKTDDSDSELVQEFIDKLKDGKAQFNVAEAWNGSFCIILLGRKQSRLAVTRTKKVDADYLLPLGRVASIIDDQAPFSARKLVEEGVIKKKTQD